VASADIVRCENCGTKNRVPSDAAGIPRCGKCHEPLPWMADADEKTFAAVVEDAVLPVLVDLWAPWCGPCRMVSPALETLARAYRGRVKLVKVNVDEAPGLAARFGVQGVPTLLLMNRRQVVARQTGAAPEPTLRTWLDQALAKVGSATA
jgi:thioredoxin 2